MSQDKLKDRVSNTATRSEKTAWDRKMNRMVTLLSKIRPIEEEIQQLNADRVTIQDDITVLRETMVNECVHPKEYLTVLDGEDNMVVCKFCNKKIRV